MKNKNLKVKKWILFIIVVIIVIFVAGAFYVADYYRSEETVESYLQGDENVTVTEIKQGLFLDGVGEENAIVFYPGAKVEYTAYVPLFYELAQQGIDCFLVKMPFNLAILGYEKAEDIMEAYHYENWYLAGHSLGGAMAALYTSDNLDEVEGLVLLAAYSTETLQDEDFRVLSVYGSKDGVLNREKLEQGRNLMPSDYTEICIEGGNHAWFGNYGEQKGDNTAEISQEEQQKQAVEAILKMITNQ